MKKLIFLLIVICLAITTSAFAQVWHTANQSTIAWDTVTELTDGDSIPSELTIEYAVYLVNAKTDPQKANPTKIGATTELQYTITLNINGRYFVGVQSVMKDAEGTLLGESEIAWSDNAEFVLDGKIFGIQYYHNPKPPKNIGVK